MDEPDEHLKEGRDLEDLFDYLLELRKMEDKMVINAINKYDEK